MDNASGFGVAHRGSESRLAIFILRRALQAIVVMWGVATLTFALAQLVPGDFTNRLGADPNVTSEMIAAMRHRFGLDRPWWVQYGLYLKNLVLHQDFGVSFSRHQPVFVVLRDGLLNTLLLQVAASAVALGLATALGVWAARRPHSWADKALCAIGAIVYSVPELLAGFLLVMFAARTRLFPIDGARSDDWDSLGFGSAVLDRLWHLALPALVIALAPFAQYFRQVRANLLDVLRAEYITTARAKGLTEDSVILKHALRNALNPLVTMFGLTLGALISGSLVVEVIFSWPGLGLITFEALWAQDQCLALGGVLMVSAVLVFGNFVADVLLAVVDPRIVRD